jgi:hypothetical protein
MDKYAWHVASGGPARHTWWVLRELPRGGREVLENKSGNTRHFKEMATAQREADKLNNREVDWSIAGLEAILESHDVVNYKSVSPELFLQIVASHIRASRALELTTTILANEAERGYDISRLRARHA